jgi:transposase
MCSSEGHVGRAPSVPGHLPRAAAARHAAGHYPPGACVQPGRQPAGLIDGAPTATHPHGVQPMGVIQHTCAWCSGYGAVALATGERFCLELPYLQADRLQRFVDAFAQAFPASLNNLRLEHRGAQTAQRLRWPEPVRCVWRPPYGPELNPIERLWRDLKDDLAWQPFTDVETQQDPVSPLWQADDTSTRPSLPSDRYVVDALNALAP